MLIVRGRCFGFHPSCHKANRILENLLWNWGKLKRPFVVYQEERIAQYKRAIVPRWLLRCYVHRIVCKCHLVQLGIHPQGWHRPGMLYSNFVESLSRSYKNPCGCDIYTWQYLVGCNNHTYNSEVAIKVSWVAISVLHDAPPSVQLEVSRWYTFLWLKVGNVHSLGINEGSAGRNG